jgi:phosphocarrier protein
MISKEIEIINRLGLHARAAAKFVTCASGYTSDVQVKFNGREVNGKSIMGIMMLAAAKGSTLTLSANGDDEQEAFDALEALINDRFGEGE